jgi:hypothetical protein
MERRKKALTNAAKRQMLKATAQPETASRKTQRENRPDKGCPWWGRCNQLQSFPQREPKSRTGFTYSHPAIRVFVRSTAPILLAVGVTRTRRFRCMAVHTGDQRPEITPLPRALLQKLPGLADDSCAVHHPALKRNWQQTLLLGQAGTRHIHPWYKKGKGGDSLSGCSRFFRGASWRVTSMLAVDRLSSI